MAGGYSTQGDVQIATSADGVPLNKIWQEINDVNLLWNEQRSALTRLISYPTTNVADVIPQGLSSDSFEEASEFGVPQSTREPAVALPLGYTFKDWDKRTSFTWKFLRDSTAEQIRSVANRAFEADNKLTTGTILRRLFSPAEGLNEHGHRVFGLWTGTDQIVPPPYMGQEFPANTTHYIASGATQIDSADIEDAISMIQSKGYGLDQNSQLLVLANPADGQFIETWRAGEESATGIKAKHDFVRSTTAPAYLTQDTIIGKQAPGSFHNLPVSGSYGPAWVIQHRFVPAGYVAVVASGGPDSPSNVVAFREHPNAAYRGLQVIPGLGKYPLSDSYFLRSFGVGVRHRGAAVCVQVTASSTYTAPTTIQI